MPDKNKQHNDINRLFDKPVITKIIIPLLCAVLSGLGVYFFSANSTQKSVEEAVLNQLTTELELQSDNRSLAEAILEIKDEKDELTNELNTANSQLEALTNSSENDIERLNQELSDLKAEMDSYVYYSPDVAVDGLSVSANKDSLLSHNGRLYYDDSIIKHFFSDEQVMWKDNHLDFNTEGSVVTVNPQLKNAVNLTKMEETSSSGWIGFEPKADNNNDMRHDVMYATNDGAEYIEYRLDQEYRWFDCYLFVTKTAANYDYDSDIWNGASVSITADNGIVLWGSSTISREAGIQYSGLIDISGVKYIRVTFYNASEWYYNGGNPYLAIDKPKLYLE